MATRWVTQADREHFREMGYMVIRGVVPRQLASEAAQDIAAFVGADLNDRATWYGGVPVLDGVVPMHHAQSQWNIRQLPELYEVFTEFFGYPRLMLDINRCIFRPPVNPEIPSISHGTIHWDTDPKVPGEGSLQALVLLTDVARNGGGFQCLPRIYQDVEGWLERHATAKNFDFFNPGLNGEETVQVEGQAGDVILWSTKLPHGTASNLSDRPRVAMFVTMQPPREGPEIREQMRRWWLERRAPDNWRGMPGQLDPEPGAPAVLSELGMKLIGAVPW